MSSRAVDRSTDSAHGLRLNAATFLRGITTLVLFATAVLVVGGTTAADAPTYAYDAPIIARTHVHEINAADARSALLSVAKEESAGPLAEARGTSTTFLSRNNATESGPSFYRGAKPGEAPSLEPRPNDFKVDAATGTVKPTHGVSVFDNPGSVTSKGFVPHEVDFASVPPELQIIQRGADAAHYEIVPQVGANLTPEQYKGLMCQMVCKS